MQAKDYLAYLVNEIHTCVVATVDDHGHPITAAVDMMDSDENGLVFLTAKGKGFYDRLKQRGTLALTGIKGNDTMTSVAVSVRGKVKELGYDKIPVLFEKNPYMYEIYPTEESMRALTAFQIFEGSGEWFDLSKKPIERANFSFGGAERRETGYFITDACIGCETCGTVCPQNCIDFSDTPAVIAEEHCLCCGNCAEVCPVGAVEKR
jgi:uncharacterized pyridoxamine 5'-phosphate oxidase family protein